MGEMVKTKGIFLRPFAIWMIVAGILTITVGFLAVFDYNYLNTTIGFVVWIFMIILGAYEITLFAPIWGQQIGSWNTIIKWLGISIIIRGLWLYVLLDITDFTIPSYSSSSFSALLLFTIVILSIISFFLEIMAFLLVYRNKPLFSAPPGEVEAIQARMKKAGIRSVSECPACQSLVEADWSSCPDCGTVLPKYCLKCGSQISDIELKCPQCGTEVIPSEAVSKMIVAMKELVEQPTTTPETKSVRYARYAEALLKGGRTNEAIEAYRKAIHFTQFSRKQTNFMVKMATIYNNTGRPKEALELLDAALRLDGEDWASASKLREEINSSKSKETLANAVKA